MKFHLFDFPFFFLKGNCGEVIVHKGDKIFFFNFNFFCFLINYWPLWLYDYERIT
jgi:hypothetical protein